jgi:hypothetical protein
MRFNHLASSSFALALVIACSSSGASPVTKKEEAAAMTDQDKAALVKAHREMFRTMVGRQIAELDALLDRNYTLTHMTGYVQPRQEWLDAVKSGQMRYHSEKEKSVGVDVNGDDAVVVGHNVVDATIYGSRGTWNLQLTTKYKRVNGKWVAMSTAATTF